MARLKNTKTYEIVFLTKERKKERKAKILSLERLQAETVVELELLNCRVAVTQRESDRPNRNSSELLTLCFWIFEPDLPK